MKLKLKLNMPTYVGTRLQKRIIKSDSHNYNAQKVAAFLSINTINKPVTLARIN